VRFEASKVATVKSPIMGRRPKVALVSAAARGVNDFYVRAVPTNPLRILASA
jgi:hypothetical protein